MSFVQHRGVVLSEGKPGAWDCRGATWCCVEYMEEDETFYLYYSGFGEKEADKPVWSIGLATSRDGVKFTKQGSPVLEHSSFCSYKAWIPVVFRVKNRFFMVFAGASEKGSGGKLGIAWADDPKGPFKVIREILRPEYFWEGAGIDLGPGYLPMAEDKLLIYYSNHAVRRSELILNMLSTFLRKGWKHLSIRDTYRYVRRRIGIAELKITGTSEWDIEILRYSGNPLTHLNGPLGSWDESLFCPGLLKTADYYCLLPTTSAYSISFPYKQYVGLVKAKSPFFQEVLAKKF